jgi:aspartyl/asparaginyl beta-hydroxylase (cupin superfamily)
VTPEIDAMFASVKDRYGDFSTERVEQMLVRGNQDRDPLQRGAKWIMPGISKTPWHDPYGHPEIVPIVRAFEDSHPAIKAEFEQAWKANSEDFSDYQHYLSTQSDWQALYLFRKGAPVEKSADVAPTAFRVLMNEVVDQGKLCTLLESHFSTLLPGASIAPHCDLWNFSINLHLAIDIPEKCHLRVAEETREWQEGKCLLFDYSYEHEAWNDSDLPRTCLLVDLWHPDTTEPEREALVGLITEIRKLTGES